MKRWFARPRQLDRSGYADVNPAVKEPRATHPIEPWRIQSPAMTEAAPAGFDELADLLRPVDGLRVRTSETICEATSGSRR